MTALTNLSNKWHIGAEELPQENRPGQNCQRQVLLEECGKGFTDIYRLDQDLRFLETSYKTTRDLVIASKIDADEPQLVVTLSLSGKSRFVDKSGKELIFDEGAVLISSFNSSIGERQYAANQSIVQLRLSMTKKWLDSYFGDNRFNKNFVGKMKLISNRPMSTQTYIAAKQLVSSSVPESFKKLYIHGQVMSILATELVELIDGGSQDTIKFDVNDRKIAYLAREILEHEFKTPPSVAELAKRAGTNEFKLKQLFHHFFNNTPHGVLLEFRMNLAYKLLQSSHCHVNVVADQVGYCHSSSFSVAFTKHFGVSPKQVWRNSKI
jgi:AraC family transcriptional regulator, transcriptional activator of the genes for pyochelin and ferripyochelin receptors